MSMFGFFAVLGMCHLRASEQAERQVPTRETQSAQASTDKSVLSLIICGGLGVVLAGTVLVVTSLQQRRVSRRPPARQELRNRAVAKWLDRDRATGDWPVPDDESSDGPLESCDDSDNAIDRNVERSRNGNHNPTAHEHRT